MQINGEGGGELKAPYVGYQNNNLLDIYMRKFSPCTEYLSFHVKRYSNAHIICQIGKFIH